MNKTDDIENSPEYKQLCDYILANDKTDLSAGVPDMLNTAENGSKPANIATNRYKRGGENLPAKKPKPKQLTLDDVLSDFSPDNDAYFVNKVESDDLDTYSLDTDRDVDNLLIEPIEPCSFLAGVPAYDYKQDYLTERNYNMTASGEQIDLISSACETAARIERGQISAVIDALPLKEDTDTYSLLEQLEALIRPHLKTKISPSRLFTIHQTLRHCRSWDIHPQGSWTVNFDKPFSFDKSPLVKIGLVSRYLDQSIFKGVPENILSASVDKFGDAYLNECFTDNLKSNLIEGRHICSIEGLDQHLWGKAYDTKGNWQACKINRE